MAMTRSATLGALAALAVPTVTKSLTGTLGDLIDRVSTDFEIAGIWLRWSWAIFAIVTAFTFIMLVLAKDR